MPTMEGMKLWLVLLNGSLVAGIYAFGKAAGSGGVGSLGVLAWQVLFAAVVITLLAWVRGQLPALNRRNLRYAGIAGVLGVTGPYLMTFSALAHLPAGLIGVIGALAPAFTYALSLALRLERLQASRAAGVALGLAGVLAIVLPRGTLPDATALPWVAVAVAGPLLLACGNVFRTLAWPAGLAPLSAASLLLVLQAAVLVPLAWSLGDLAWPQAVWTRRDIGLLGAGVLTAAFYLSAFELQRLAGPVGAGQMGYVITAASLAIGVLVFGEHYPLSALAAVAMVMAGVALVNRERPGPRGYAVGATTAALSRRAAVARK